MQGSNKVIERPGHPQKSDVPGGARGDGGRTLIRRIMQLEMSLLLNFYYLLLNFSEMVSSRRKILLIVKVISVSYFNLCRREDDDEWFT